MAKLGQSYTTADIPAPMTFEVMPPGDHKMMVTHSSEKETNGKDGMGKMIVLEIDIQDGDFAGRKVFQNFNIENPNPKAVEIALRELGALARAVNVKELSDTEQLHYKMFVGTLAVQPAKPYIDKKTGEEKPGFASNRITKYMPVSAAATAKATAKVAVTENNDEASAGDAVKEDPKKGANPPWKSKK